MNWQDKQVNARLQNKTGNILQGLKKNEETFEFDQKLKDAQEWYKTCIKNSKGVESDIECTRQMQNHMMKF